MAQPATRRLTKAEWLHRALDALAAQGEAELRIDRLTARLGVTKGSFYWHFEDRADFVRQVAEFWELEHTERVRDAIAGLPATASEKLLELMRRVVAEGAGKFDVVMRAWASHDPAVARIVRRVDRGRFSTVDELFAELGFEGDELDRRTRLFVTYMSFESNLTPKRSRRQRLDDLPALHALLTASDL